MGSIRAAGGEAIDEIVLHRPERRGCTRRHADLRVHVLNVVVGRLGGDEELLGDRDHRESSRRELEHLDLPLGEVAGLLAPGAPRARIRPVPGRNENRIHRGAVEQPVAGVAPDHDGGIYLDGDPAANALGCSGHWFTERAGLVAAGWYEHGTRFIDVDQQTGAITEVGYFQPVYGSASAAHWVTDDIVYVVDYARGIDILRFDRAAAAASDAELAASWALPVNPVAARLAERERLYCSLATA